MLIPPVSLGAEDESDDLATKPILSLYHSTKLLWTAGLGSVQADSVYFSGGSANHDRNLAKITTKMTLLIAPSSEINLFDCKMRAGSIYIIARPQKGNWFPRRKNLAFHAIRQDPRTNARYQRKC